MPYDAQLPHSTHAVTANEDLGFMNAVHSVVMTDDSDFSHWTDRDGLNTAPHAAPYAAPIDRQLVTTATAHGATNKLFCNAILGSLVLHLLVIVAISLCRFSPAAVPLAASVMPVQLIGMAQHAAAATPQALANAGATHQAAPEQVVPQLVAPKPKATLATNKTPAHRTPASLAKTTAKAAQPLTPVAVQALVEKPSDAALANVTSVSGGKSALSGIPTAVATATPTPSASAAESSPALRQQAASSELAVYCKVRPAPVYPAMSRRLREAGLVLVEVQLDAKGTVANARVIQSSGYARLDTAAVAALKQWRCNANPNASQPIVAQQPFHFGLTPAR